MNKTHFVLFKKWVCASTAYRIIRLNFKYGVKSCDGCGKFTNKIYSIPYVESALLVCKKCNEADLNGE